uniref:Uncharacterized protein n=1 Tax=Tanacetum cinerariifolium TaxID=118510 RepID=A0A699J4C3_TANCI|nr:hypothetical protein [Tanacetum cinerariifolium]
MSSGKHHTHLSKKQRNEFCKDHILSKKEERDHLIAASRGASTTPSYSSGPSTTQSYSSGPSTTPSYSPGPSTPSSDSPRPSRSAVCSNCKLLIGKIKVVEATLQMYMHLENHILDSTAQFH